MTEEQTLQSSPTQELAAFASALTFEAIPTTTIEHVKLSVLDTIGCVLFGSTLPWIESLRDTILDEGGNSQATLLGSSQRVSKTQAALVNATAAHSFEFDDIHMGGMIHPGALALSASLATGEESGIDGKTLLTAIVAGCEVGARVGKSVGITHFRAGYHPQGTIGVFVAGASAGRAMMLGVSEMRNALGIAGTRAAGLMAAQEGSMTKRLHSGLACESGVRGALLAANGFTGIENVLEADFGGFCSTMGGGDVHLDELTSELGVRWETDEIGFKPYASCAAAQSSIEVVRQIRNEMLQTNSTARSVTIFSSTHSKIHCGWEYRANGVTAAQMNIPYGVASMLLYGEVSADQFTENAINNPGTLDLAHRVTVIGDENIDALGPDRRYTVRVEVHTNDDRILTGEASDRPGGPTQPMTPSAINEKFDGLVAPLLGESSAKQLRSAVERLEAIDDVAILLSIMKIANSPS